MGIDIEATTSLVLGFAFWLAYGVGQVATGLVNAGFDRWFGVARDR